MLAKVAALAAGLSVSAAALGQASTIDLSKYVLQRTFDLPAVAASEASAITYNWDSGTLFVLGDEGTAVVEVERGGAFVSQMSLSGFEDTEGLTYVGNGRFVIVEERLQDVFLFTYAAGGTAARGSMPAFSFGDSVGNIGLEGIAYDPADGSFVAVKEKDSQAVYGARIDFAAAPPTGTVASLFDPAGLMLADLSDVAVLTTVPSLTAAAQQGLLVFSQESARLVHATRAGAVLGTFDLVGVGNAEGVTIDPNGVIYIASEVPRVYVLAPVPEPSTWLLLAGGLGALVLAARRRTTR